MVDALRHALEDVNRMLTEEGVTPFRIGVAHVDDFRPAPKNAHFMRQEVYERLVENVRQDGNLSSVPFCWRHEGIPYTLSGHHRIDAARDAGVEWVLYLYTDEQLTESQRVAIQLSHNALIGQDNLATLKELYDQLSNFDDVQYSGLDDELVQRFENVAPSTFQDARLDFEEVVLVFMPHEVERIDEVIDRLRAYPGVDRLYSADYGDWERFWSTLLRFKEARNVVNSATALRAMVEIVGEWLDAQAVEEEAAGE